MNIKMKLFTCALAAVSAFVGRAAVVPTGGLVEAVRNAKDGDVLELGAETYEITDELVLTNGVTIVGAGIDQTIIRQTTTDKHVAVLDNAAARIEGCNLTGANFPNELKDGVGVRIKANGGTIDRCRVTGNTTSRNWNICVGVYCTSAQGTVSNSIIDNNKVTGGTANTYGGALNFSAGTIDRCLVYNNKGHATGGLYVTGAVKVLNCTFVDNEAGSDTPAGNVYLSGAAEFTNCIFARGKCPAGRTESSQPEWTGTAAATFTDCSFPTKVSLGTVWKGNASNADPVFVVGANGDYTQRLRSPTRDIGYYAPYDYSVLGCDLTLSAQSVFVDGEISFVSYVSGVGDDDVVAYAWTVTKPSGVAETLTEEQLVYVPEETGVYTVALSVSKNGGDPVLAPETASFKAVDRNVSVSTSEQLADAVDHALGGMTITLAAGTYEITRALTLGVGVTLRGAGKDKTTIRQKTVSERVVYLNHPDDLVEGVSLVGREMKAEKLHGTVACIFTGGGTIRACDITGGNKTGGNWTHGLGVAVLGPGLVDHCVISNNVRTIGTNMYGGGAYMEDGTLDTCLICHNSTHQGGGIYVTSSKCKVYNCTVVDNMVTASGGGLCASSGTFVNCLFARNTSTDATATDTTREYSGSAGATFTRCMWPAKVSSAALGANCVFSDAIFVDADHRDYHVQSSSKSKDAGADYEGLPETDLDGSPRVSGGGPDIGCYEFDSSSFTCAFDNEPKQGFIGSTSVFTAVPTGLEPGATVLCKWTVTDPTGRVTTFEKNELTMSINGSMAGKYYVSLTAASGGSESEPYAPIDACFTVSPTNFYVKEATEENAAKSEFPYDTWETAATNLLDVIPWTLDTATIHLGEGEIAVSDRVDLEREVTLVGEGWRKTTLRQKAQTKSVLYLNNAKAVARGMTITGLRASSEIHSRGAVIIEKQGGVVEDCRITGNRYTGDTINQACGIGITVNSEKGICRRCIIDRNKGSAGVNNDCGGGVQGLEGLIENCLVCFNTNKQAAGVYLNPASGKTVTLRNCTVYGNVAVGEDNGYGQNGAGGIAIGGPNVGLGYGTSVIQNTIFAANVSLKQTWDVKAGYPEWRFTAGTFKFVNCLLPEGIDWPAGAEGCLNGDPLFKDAAAGDFHLTASSPAAYKGARLDYTAESTDLDGNPRIFNFKFSKAKPDLGCYESPFGIPGLLLLVK